MPDQITDDTQDDSQDDVQHDERGQGRGRQQGKRRRSDSDPKLVGEMANAYLTDLVHEAVKRGWEADKAQEAIARLEELVGKELLTGAIKTGLPAVSALVNINRGLRSMGLPGPLAKMAENGLNEIFQATRQAFSERGQLDRQGAQRILGQVQQTATKMFEEMTYEQAFLFLDETEQKTLDAIFLALPTTHQARYEAVRAKLRSLADIKLLLRRFTDLRQEFPVMAMSAILEKLEPMYIGVQVAAATPPVATGFTSFTDRLGKVVKGFLDSLERAVTRPERITAKRKLVATVRQINNVNMHRQNRRTW